MKQNEVLGIIENAKNEVKILVEKYQKIVEEKRISKYNEEMTKAEFIEPLFEALGWDIRNKHHKDEVTREEQISKDRVDYSFRINGIPKFFLEAKPLKANLDDPKYVEQAIHYAWNKGCTWAVLTDFEAVKIFNAEWRTTDYSQNHLKTIPCYEFLDRFSELWLLSKDSFEKGLLDKEAEKWGKKTKKTSVDKQLLSDFTYFREILSKSITKLNQNKNVSQEELDESIQRILDRLIFIRNCEDRGLEERQLISNLRVWEDKGKGQLVKNLHDVFSYFDKQYNGRIFTTHLCDDLEIDNEVLHEVIEGLYYTKDKVISYDFSAIEADILGNIYEQYLGHILRKTAKRATLTESQIHRKEQGIFYTPTYIVDFIVKSTLGKMLENQKIKSEKIRVLDMACGSGSFLIKAYDVLNDYYLKHDKDYAQTILDSTVESGTYTKKLKILHDNIFGVDLDLQAVEVAQLNLLLKVTEKGQRLPLLQRNIKRGNSLIQTSISTTDRPFNWNTEFAEVMNENGFDVIIGNPPYIRIQTLDRNQVEYFNKNYESATKNYDIYILFIEKGFKLLKEEGILGFILPHKFFQGESGEKIRKFIYKNKAMHKIVDFGANQVFEDATTYTCLLFLQKKKNKEVYYKGFKLDDDFKNLHSIKFEKRDIEILKRDKWNFANDDVQMVLAKIYTHKNNFETITRKIFKGSSTGDDDIFLLDLIKNEKETSTVFSSALNQETKIETELLHPFVYGEDVRRYAPMISNKVLLFPYSSEDGNVELIPIEHLKRNYPKTYSYLNKVKDRLLNRKVELDNNNFYKFSAARSLSEYTQPKIMIPDMLVSNRMSFDEKGVLYHGPAIHSVVFHDKLKVHSPYFYLGILNSTLFWFFIVNTSTALRGNAYRLTPEFLTPFCFPEVDVKNKNLYDKLVTLVEKMLQLNKKLAELGAKKTNERLLIENEIKKINVEIDDTIYKIYGLTEDEIKIIRATV